MSEANQSQQGLMPCKHNCQDHSHILKVMQLILAKHHPHATPVLGNMFTTLPPGLPSCPPLSSLQLPWASLAAAPLPAEDTPHHTG